MYSVKIENKIKVAHFLREYIRLTESFIFNQLKSLNNNNKFEPIVFCKILKKNYLDESINIKEINELLSNRERKIDDYFYKFLRRLTTRASQKIYQSILENEIKILHFHYLIEARFFLEVLDHCNIPSIVSAYGWDVSNFPKKYLGAGLKYLEPIFKKNNLFLAMSDDMKRDLISIGCPESKVLVHYHGINTKRFIVNNRDYSSNNVKVLFCGRLTYKKAPNLFLESLRLIEKNKLSALPFSIKIIGDGPLKESLEKQIIEYGWQDKAKLLGHIPHQSKKLLDEYKVADIFVLPSMISKNDKEGIPGTLVEAMASSLPIVSTFHAGIPEIIENNKSGLLVKEGDIDGLANSVARLLNSQELRKYLGENARNRSKDLDIDTKTKELENIYNNLLQVSTN